MQTIKMGNKWFAVINKEHVLKVLSVGVTRCREGDHCPILRTSEDYQLYYFYLATKLGGKVALTYNVK